MGLAVPGGSLEGAPGAPGATPVLQAGNAAALPPGSAPQVALRVVAKDTYALDVSWPRAADGAAGATPTLQVGNITSLAAGAAATAAVRSLGGSAYAIDLGIPVGATGGKGDAGATPTLQVGNVTSLAAGAAATAAVRSLGGSAYAIDLGIPAGAAGATGATAWAPVVAWQPNTPYTSNAPASVVTYDDGAGAQTYVAKPGIGNFVSGSTFSAANWTLLSARGAAGATGASGVMSTLSSMKVTSTQSIDVKGSAPAGTTHIRVVAIGGGASGQSLTNMSNSAFGGMCGLVRDITIPIASFPNGALLATIGTGGQGFSSTSGDWGTLANWTRAGGDTSLAGVIKALGGLSSSGFASYANILNLFSARYLPSPPGSVSPNMLNGGPAYDSQYGPGSGGSGAPGYNGSSYVAASGGAGAASNAGDPSLTVAGAAASSGVGANGNNAVGFEDFGSGGAGGGCGAGTATSGGFAGGNGGVPGGGGGGANRGAQSGNGARGELRIFYLKQG